jgi:prolycopene isomerase
LSHKYDTIVIGSGLGGLTCGAFLAKAGMKVLVLEQHQKIGGYAHNFKRRKFTFESGIHSVALSDQGMIMHLLKLLGVDHTIEKIAFPEMFNMATPDYSMSMPARKEDIVTYLEDRFPSQKQNIVRLVNELRVFYDKIRNCDFDFEHTFVKNNAEFISQYHNRSYKSFIDNIFTDDKLRLLFHSQWPYCGASPCYGSILYYFMMYVVHWFEGTHSCKGGFTELANALAKAITDRGGEVKTKSLVTEIDADNKRAHRVRIVTGEEYEGKIFVSNTSPYLLHNKLLSEDARSRRWQRRISNLRASPSSVIVYLGMKPAFHELVNKNILFWYSSNDFKQIFSNIQKDKKDSIDHLIFLKSVEKSDNPTLTLMNFVQKSFSTDWKNEKMRIADRMLQKAEELFPGFNEYIELQEVGSPSTFERYTMNTEGTLYGFENTKQMYGEAKMPITTHLDNLFQTGHWGKPGGGVWNVMANAYSAARIILKKQ